jgi:hypothetical protein
MKSELLTNDETNLTELEIGPDGRVYVFGASPEVLQILDALRKQDESIRQRLGRIPQHPSVPAFTALSNRSEIEAQP